MFDTDHAFLALVAQILAYTQIAKRILEKWDWLIDKLGLEKFGGIAAVVLACIVGAATGVIEYGNDGTITWEETLLIIDAIAVAAGGFNLLKAIFGGADRTPGRIPIGGSD